MIKDLFLKLYSSDFGRNTVTLTFGTVIAQILPILFYPIFGRIYTPEEFGLFATVSAIVPIITILASGMYESAILISDSKQEAANIVGLILIRSVMVVFLTFIIFLFFPNQLNSLLNEPNLSKWLFVIPFAAFFAVIYNTFNEWCVTNKYFTVLSWNKILNTSAISAGKLGFGLYKVFGNGLIIGDIVGKALSTGSFIYRALKLDKEYFLNITFSKIKFLRRKYIDLPKFLMADQILNNIGGSIHVFFISAYFSSTELGYVSMAASLLTVPISVISSAIKDVFRQRANQEFINTGSCRTTYIRLIKPITIFALILFVPLYFILPTLFTTLLGDRWLLAGVYSQILLPMFLMNFISMSLGGVLIIAQKIKVSLYWQIYTVLTSVISFLIGQLVFGTIEMVLFCFMIARTSSYILYIFISFYYAKSN